MKTKRFLSRPWRLAWAVLMLALAAWLFIAGAWNAADQQPLFATAYFMGSVIWTLNARDVFRLP